MGELSQQLRRETQRTIRSTPLSAAERKLLDGAKYEGDARHKNNPRAFGLKPPYPDPRPDKTKCEEAQITSPREADELFRRGIKRALVSEAKKNNGFPNEFWVVDDNGNVFEAMYGGSRKGHYHGYPVRRTDPFFSKISKAWQGKT